MQRQRATTDKLHGAGPGLAVAALAAGLAGAALAQSGVKNAAVKARMALMGEIKDATAVIGGMVKGEIAFDAGKAAAARTALMRHAQQIAPVFEARETDPKSESRSEIWSDWAGFVGKADALAVAAGALDTGSAAGLAAGMGALGKSCGGCHKLFRIDK